MFGLWDMIVIAIVCSSAAGIYGAYLNSKRRSEPRNSEILQRLDTL